MKRPGIGDGFLLMDKEQGWTSHDVVAKVRGIVGGKVGHAGTLDPMATGLLVLGLGRSTRLLRFVQGFEKEYQATAMWRQTRSTQMGRSSTDPRSLWKWPIWIRRPSDSAVRSCRFRRWCRPGRSRGSASTNWRGPARSLSVRPGLSRSTRSSSPILRRPTIPRCRSMSSAAPARTCARSPTILPEHSVVEPT